MARFLNKALFLPQKRLLDFYLPNTWVENPLNACETVRMCYLCTMINGGRMHYMRLFGFKASSVQRYFFQDNLISRCRYSESNRFWMLQLKANFPKVPSNIIAIADLSSPTREICRPTTSHLMMQKLELYLEEAIEMEISQTRRPERSFTVCRNFAPTRW